MKEPMRKVLHLCLHFLLYIAIVGLFSLYVQEVENLVVGAVRVSGSTKGEGRQPDHELQSHQEGAGPEVRCKYNLVNWKMNLHRYGRCPLGDGPLGVRPPHHLEEALRLLLVGKLPLLHHLQEVDKTCPVCDISLVHQKTINMI